MDEAQQIQAFLAGTRFAVVGASRDRSKYGNRVLRAYVQNERDVVAVNPKVDEVEGVPCYGNLGAIPGTVHGVSIVTPPDVTANVIDEAIELKIAHVWLQPGAEHDGAIDRARASGISVIAHGPCLLVVLGYHESVDPV